MLLNKVTSLRKRLLGGDIIATNLDFTPSTRYTRVSIGSSSGSTTVLGSGNGQVTIYNLSQYYYNEIRMNATPSTVQITSMNGKTYNGTLTASQKRILFKMEQM